MDNSIKFDPNMESINQQIERIEQCEKSKVKKIQVEMTNFVLTEKMIQDLEEGLLRDDNDADSGKNKTAKEHMENNMKILNVIRRRILLKQKAFEVFPAVIKSNFTVLCRFFLLKAQLFEISFLLSILYSSENQLKLPHWDEFKKKSGFSKFVSAILSQENDINDLLDNRLDKAMTASAMISKKQSVSMIRKYLNDDPYQNPEPVLKVILPLIICQFFDYKKVIIKKDKNKAILKGRLKILLQLILMTYDYGVFEIENQMVDQFDVFYRNRKVKNPLRLEQVYQDLSG